MDHSLRQILAGDAHARPTLPVDRPALVLHEARFHEDGGRASRAYAETIATRLGAKAPAADVDHLLADLDGGALKWERHGEFSTWTWTRPGPIGPAGPIAVPEILSQAPGPRFVAAAVFVDVASPDPELLDAMFGVESAEADRAGSLMNGGLCGVWTGFRIGPDGWTRFLFADLGLGRFRAGRVVRRLLEVETYRTAAMFAFPLARQARRELDRLERQVGDAIADTDKPENEVLDELIDASRDVERLAQDTAFRFGAAAAYRRLIDQRIEEFREVRIEGLQRLSAFLSRRFAPAMDTCAATQARLETLSKRLERAAGMLRTRVDLSRAAQNQQLLASMNDNAKAQLRLQRAVEGFSVAAISYYAFSLLAKALYPVSGSLGAAKAAFETALVVVTVAAVWFVLRRLRRDLDP